jgi:hypothetical protein
MAFRAFMPLLDEMIGRGLQSVIVISIIEGICQNENLILYQRLRSRFCLRW